MVVEPLSPVVEQNHISRITITKLFGHLDYDLSLTTKDSAHDDLMILYGDNGSGKTTLLTMIFNILSTQRGQGYKTYLSRTPFSRFAIEFSSGSLVVVQKPPDQLIGGYTVNIITSDGTTHDFNLTADSDYALKSKDNPFDELDNALTELGVSLYFLPDDRKVKAHFPYEAADDLSAVQRAYYQNYQTRLASRTHRASASSAAARAASEWVLLSHGGSEDSESHHLEIAPVLEALATALRRQTIQGSNTGEENASSIYLRVVEQLKSVQLALTSTPRPQT